MPGPIINLHWLKWLHSRDHIINIHQLKWLYSRPYHQIIMVGTSEPVHWCQLLLFTRKFHGFQNSDSLPGLGDTSNGCVPYEQACLFYGIWPVNNRSVKKHPKSESCEYFSYMQLAAPNSSKIPVCIDWNDFIDLTDHQLTSTEMTLQYTLSPLATMSSGCSRRVLDICDLCTRPEMYHIMV